MPKISVIIPVYNAELYIKRCLKSIINQTFKDIEIICINDKSTDNSVKIIEEISKDDERIKIINNETNLGAALSRNKGLDTANGEFIYFIDADDYINEKYLDCMFKKIKEKNCDIVLNLSIENESGNIITPYKHPSMPEIKQNGEFLDKITIIHDAPCFIWARIYRKSFLDKHNLRFLDIHATDDVTFNTISSMYCNETFVFFGETYHYTINNSGVTGTAKSVDDRDLQHIKAHSFIYDFLKEHHLLDSRLKLFRVYPFMKVDNEIKFNFYKEFFEKIQTEFHKYENIYNELEKYFAQSILNSSDYTQYLTNYNKIVSIGFLRRKKDN